MPRLILIFTLAFLANCGAWRNSNKQAGTFGVQTDTLSITDSSRNRPIPIAVYTPISDKAIQNQTLVILSHGYFANQAGGNLQYSYLTHFLASHGLIVISIQHELPGDSLIPSAGIPQIVRRPFWERGVQNILFVLNAYKKTNPEWDYKHVTLIGHSNGGDMSMLFGQKYPDLADKIISLDNRRMALPRTRHPKIYSLRSSDQPPDEGVLPTVDEQKKYNIKIIQLKNTRHNEMDNSGSDAQKTEINNYIWTFIND